MAAFKWLPAVKLTNTNARGWETTPFFLYGGLQMNVKQLTHRASMQLGDTNQFKFTPYLLVEYYNEGLERLNVLIAKYMPSYNEKEFVANGVGAIELPEQAVAINKVTNDGKEIDKFNVKAMKSISFDADKESKIAVTYIPTCEYKYLEDDTGLPVEFESMLVGYMVTRALGGDIYGLVSSWDSLVYDMAKGSNSSTGVVYSRGYYDYDSIRTDYND